MSGDPVSLGLVASLNRPGANVTGFTSLNAELAPKRLQLLRELLPNVTRFGVLVDLAEPTTQSNIADLQAAARTLGAQLVVVNATTDNDLQTAFATFSQQEDVEAILTKMQAARPEPKEHLFAFGMVASGATLL
jgi:putative ABC transport system substrate-binding protein